MDYWVAFLHLLLQHNSHQRRIVINSIECNYLLRVFVQFDASDLRRRNHVRTQLSYRLFNFCQHSHTSVLVSQQVQKRILSIELRQFKLLRQCDLTFALIGSPLNTNPFHRPARITEYVITHVRSGSFVVNSLCPLFIGRRAV